MMKKNIGEKIVFLSQLRPFKRLTLEPLCKFILQNTALIRSHLSLLVIVFFEVWRKLQIVLIIQQLFVSHYEAAQNTKIMMSEGGIIWIKLVEKMKQPKIQK